MIVLHILDRAIRFPKRFRDAEEFVEAEHPRTKGGKFAKKGTGVAGGGAQAAPRFPGAAHSEGIVRSRLAKYLKAGGFKRAKGKTPGGHYTYTNGKGQKIFVGPHKEGVKVFQAWYHIPSGKQGSSPEQLKQFLEGGGPETIFPKAEAKPAETVHPGGNVPAPPPAHALKVKPLVDYLGLKPAADLGTAYKYTGEAGQLVVGKKTVEGMYAWTFQPTGKSASSGHGLSSLKEYIENVVQNAPASVNPKQITFPANNDIKKLDPSATVEHGASVPAAIGLGQYATRWVYKDPANGAHTSVIFGTGENAGKWRIWQSGKGEIAKGEGQESFNQAFEGLHPRGEGGKFVAKPGAAGGGEAAPEHKGTEYEPTIVANGFKATGQMAGAFLKYDGPADTKLYIDTENNWVYYAKTGEMGVSGKGASDLAAKLPTPSVPAAAKEAISAQPLQMSALTQVGPQKGSNPGGVFEDSFGTKYYVKKPQSVNHVKNELLAAALYSASGAPTLKYHSVEDGSNLAIATTYENLKADNVSQLTSAQKAEARKHFALQAWLANWDAAGLSGDNVGVNAENKVLPLDFGGSLLYRAQGGSKLSKFTSSVDEWHSMRNPAINKSSGDLYGDMTTTELQQSAKLLDNISDETIKKLVATYGPAADSGITQNDLAQRLIERKNKIKELAKGTVVTGSASPPPTPEQPKETPGQLRNKIAGWNPPGKPKTAIADYKGSGYKPMNELMRTMELDDQPDPNDIHEVRINAITKWLDKASTQEDCVLYRGIPKSEYALTLIKTAKIGRRTMEHGFSSMSSSESFSTGWAKREGTGSNVLYKVHVPKGSMVATVRDVDQDDSEYESLAQRNTRFRIIKVLNPPPGVQAYYEVEMIQPKHLKHNP